MGRYRGSSSNYRIPDTITEFVATVSTLTAAEIVMAIVSMIGNYLSRLAGYIAYYIFGITVISTEAKWFNKKCDALGICILVEQWPSEHIEFYYSFPLVVKYKVVFILRHWLYYKLIGKYNPKQMLAFGYELTKVGYSFAWVGNVDRNLWRGNWVDIFNKLYHGETVTEEETALGGRALIPIPASGSYERQMVPVRIRRRTVKTRSRVGFKVSENIETSYMIEIVNGVCVPNTPNSYEEDILTHLTFTECKDYGDAVTTFINFVSGLRRNPPST